MPIDNETLGQMVNELFDRMRSTESNIIMIQKDQCEISRQIKAMWKSVDQFRKTQWIVMGMIVYSILDKGGSISSFVKLIFGGG